MQYRNDRNGAPLSILGYGCMRFSRKGTGIDIDKTEQEILAAYRAGVNYYDTAYIYPGSEAALGEILERNGIREQVNIATKLPQYMVGSRAALDRFFDEELARLRTGRVDYYLIHHLTDIAQWERLKGLGIEEWIREKKDGGAIRNIGFSYHGNTANFLKILADYDWDFCQIQYNYLDEFAQAGVEGLKAAAARGIPVIIMEPLRGGKLVNLLPEDAKQAIAANPRGWTPAEWGLRWLYNQPEVTVVLSGMNSREMVEENLRTASDAACGAFTEADFALIEEVKRRIRAKEKVGCTGCRYCMPCPKGVDIPGHFLCYNTMYSESRMAGWSQYVQTVALTKEPSYASQCIQCCKCEKHCPQEIPIREKLKEAEKALRPLPIRIVAGIMRKFMNRGLSILFLALLSLSMWAQGGSALEQLRRDPLKSYGNDYPYLFETVQPSPAPRGYKPFYISHYARHGSRYYWNETLYHQLDTLMTLAHERHQLTPEGEAFYGRFMAAKQELITGISELTQLGWDQHQRIAHTMYNRFPEVFRDGGYVLAVSSLSGRCVLSMSAFCQELVQCNPKIEIREQSSRFTLDAVVPTDKENPVKHNFPKVKPRYEQHRDRFQDDTPALRDRILSRVFTSTEGLPGNRRQIADRLIDLYSSLPNIGHEGMMGSIITDEEMVARWEAANLGSYSWVFSDQYQTVPILDDILAKADAAIAGTSDHRADLRFGHDSCIGPLTVLMGLNGADRDPEDPYEVKDCYQNWETCKASNIQLVFYRSRRNPADILVKCLLNGFEVSLPVQTDTFPYYRWEDVRRFYRERCDSVKMF